MEEDKNEESIVLKRVARRMAYGTIVGWLIGMFIQPPFKGMTGTSSDVQGLIYFSWLMAAGGGMIMGAFAGLIGKQQQKKTEKSAKGSSNKAL